MGLKQPPSRVRGTRDFLPGDWKRITYIFNVWKRIATRYGFQEIEMPILERYELFAQKSGEELSQQLFEFLDKSDRRLCLRAETTPIVARMYMENEKTLVKPVKWFSLSRLFRYETPQKGRLREFFQFNLDILGSGGNHATAEVIACAIDILKEFKLTRQEFVMLLSNRKLIEGLVQQKTENKASGEIFSIIDKISKISEEEFHEALSNLGLTDPEINRIQTIAKMRGPPFQILEQLEKLDMNELAARGFQELKDTCEILDDYKVLDYCEIDLSIVRGLAYYVGVVYEAFDTSGALRSILGGGDYTTMYGGQPAPATGFGFGDPVLGVLLDELGKFPKFKEELDAFIVTVDSSVQSVALQTLSTLRQQGLRVDIDLEGRKFRKQLQQADRRGAKFAIILGEKDVEEKSITIKDLRSGEQKKILHNKLDSFDWT